MDNLTCGECALRIGEECGGKYEGREVYDDTAACDEFEPQERPDDLP